MANPSEREAAPPDPPTRTSKTIRPEPQNRGSHVHRLEGRGSDPRPPGSDQVIALVRDRRYEEALQLLRAMDAMRPHDRSIHASIRGISEKLADVYAHRLGGLDAILQASAAAEVAGVEARAILDLVDGRATVGDITRSSHLGKLDTLRVLCRLFPEPPPPTRAEPNRRQTREFFGQKRSRDSAAPPSGFVASTARRHAEKEQTMSRVDDLNRILRALQTNSPDVEASALISEDGLMIASALPQHIDETRVAGMSATLSSLGARAASELERGDVDEVLVRGKNGYAVMMSAGSGTLLLCLTSQAAKLGLIFLDMRRAIDDIRKIL